LQQLCAEHPLQQHRQQQLQAHITNCHLTTQYDDAIIQVIYKYMYVAIQALTSINAIGPAPLRGIIQVMSTDMPLSHGLS
jgi:hypothetical protein